MLDFLGWSATTGQIEQAIQNASRDKMRQAESDGMDLNDVGTSDPLPLSEKYSDAEMKVFLSYAEQTLETLGYVG